MYTIFVFLLGYISRSIIGGIQTNRHKQKIGSVSNGDGEYLVNVVGESQYQDNIASICGGKTKYGHRYQCVADIILENDNRHDKNAVRIEIDGKTVGYLTRDDAVIYRKELNETAPNLSIVQCDALIVGGWRRENDDEGHFGVKLDLP